MADEQHEAPEEEPSFVADEVASAGAEKPAVASDEDAPEDQSQVPSPFDVADAIPQTANDPPGDEH